MNVPAHDSAKQIRQLADQCVRCGLCSAVCPTYALDGVENESPRGRILAMQALADMAQPEQSLLQARDHCLGCLQCQRHCPSRVQYAQLLDLSREQHPPVMPMVERALLWLVQSPWRIRVAQGLVPLFRPWLLKRGFPPADPCPAPDNPPRSTKGHVALFRGCASRWADRKTLADTRWLIHHAGYKVVEAAGEGCCGALHQHEGQPRVARRLAERNRRALRQLADVLLYTASGCAAQLSASLGEDLQVEDALHWLVQHLPEAPLREHRRVALHLPCTLRNQPESCQILVETVGRYCQTEVLMLSDGCCGAAGAHLLREPDRAARLRDPLLQTLQNVDLLLSSNIGCALHLRAGLYQQGRDLPVLHPLSWLRNLHEENPTCTL